MPDHAQFEDHSAVATCSPYVVKTVAGAIIDQAEVSARHADLSFSLTLPPGFFSSATVEGGNVSLSGHPITAQEPGELVRVHLYPGDLISAALDLRRALIAMLTPALEGRYHKSETV